jgi:hypothetical protein
VIVYQGTDPLNRGSLVATLFARSPNRVGSDFNDARMARDTAWNRAESTLIDRFQLFPRTAVRRLLRV